MIVFQQRGRQTLEGRRTNEKRMDADRSREDSPTVCNSPAFQLVPYGNRRVFHDQRGKTLFGNLGILLRTRHTIHTLLKPSVDILAEKQEHADFLIPPDEYSLFEI